MGVYPIVGFIPPAAPCTVLANGEIEDCAMVAIFPDVGVAPRTPPNAPGATGLAPVSESFIFCQKFLVSCWGLRLTVVFGD